MDINWKDIPLTDLAFNNRALNALRKVGIHSVGELLNLSEDNLYRIPGLGKLTRKHIVDVLSEQSLKLKENQCNKPFWIKSAADSCSDKWFETCMTPEQSICVKCPHLINCTIQNHTKF